jgi:hypothetical protein
MFNSLAQSFTGAIAEGERIHERYRRHRDKLENAYGQVRTHGELIQHNIDEFKHASKIRTARNINAGGRNAINRHAGLATDIRTKRHLKDTGKALDRESIAGYKTERKEDYKRAHGKAITRRAVLKVARVKQQEIEAKKKAELRAKQKKATKRSVNHVFVNASQAFGVPISHSKPIKAKTATSKPEKIMVLNGQVYRLIRVTANSVPTEKRIEKAGKAAHVIDVGKKKAVYASTKKIKA